MDHVVVVGAGIGGLAASLTLGRVARHVTLVERVDHPGEVGAALALQANGLAVLEKLGLLSVLQREGSRIDQVAIRNPRGSALMMAAMPDFGGGLDHALAVRRSQLHSVLLGAVEACDQVRTVFGATLIHAGPNGALSVQSGPDASAVTISAADLVVGADGANSVVRQTGGFSSTMSAGSRYVRAVVRRSDTPGFEEFWTPLGSFGHASLDANSTYFWAAAHAQSVTEAVDDRDLGSFAQAWARVLPLAGELLSDVDSFDHLLVNTVRRVDCRRWFSGRLVLLGDAAHAMAPNLGQGANSALSDAVALAEAVATTASVPAATHRYDHLRRRAARRVQNTAGLLDRLCNLHHAGAIQVRDAVLSAMTRVPGLGEVTTRRALDRDVEAVRSATIWETAPRSNRS